MGSPRFPVHSLQRATAVLILAAVAVIGVACSGGDDETSTPAAPRTTAAAATTPPPTTAAGGATEPSGETVSVGDDAGGKHLVGPNGLALYFFANDEMGASSCTAGCAQNWPPLTVDAGATPTAAAGVTGTLDTIDRDDGSKQVTLDGHPLYFFSGDSAPGDINGDGVGGVWSLARPTGAASGTAGGGGAIAPVNATRSTGYGY